MPDDVRERVEEREVYPEVSVIREIRSTWEGGLWIRRPGEEPWDTEGPIDVFGPGRQYVGTFAADATTMPRAFGPDGLVAYWEVERAGCADDYREEVAGGGEVAEHPPRLERPHLELLYVIQI